MKIVLKEQDAKTVLLSDVIQSKIYIYTGNAGGVWILSKLGRYHSKNLQDHDKLGRGEYHYGFVRVDKTEDVAVFTAQWDRDSVEKALSSGRKVLEFNTFGDFMKWRLKVNDDTAKYTKEDMLRFKHDTELHSNTAFSKAWGNKLTCQEMEEKWFELNP